MIFICYCFISTDSNILFFDNIFYKDFAYKFSVDFLDTGSNSNELYKFI